MNTVFYTILQWNNEVRAKLKTSTRLQLGLLEIANELCQMQCENVLCCGMESSFWQCIVNSFTIEVAL